VAVVTAAPRVVGPRYVYQRGDVRWRIPSPRGFGFIFSRSADLAGADLPTGALVRVVGAESRAWLLFGVDLARVEAGDGAVEADFCAGRWRAWAEHWGISSAGAPETVEALSIPFKWERV
jgi:hypothetical protein